MNQNISIIELNNKTIYLLGTAHVSQNSAKEAYDLIHEVKPDCVCIELDDERFEGIQNENKWKDTDIFTIIKQKKVGFMFANIILGSYQKRLAEQFGIKAGYEMIQSIQAANEVNARIVNADRNIKTTFMRIWRKMRFPQKIKLIFNLLLGFLDDEEMTEEDLEQLKTQDMLQSALNQLGDEFPDIKKYLLDERDMFIAQKIKEADGDVVVAVVGAAHAPGIKVNINNDTNLDEISEVPNPSKLNKVIGWIIPIIIILMIGVTMVNDMTSGMDQIKQWILYNSICSALFTIFAFGHILSIITAFIVAPITSLNPLIAAGWFAGLVEAYMRKPTVSDFENLSSDLVSLKGVWKNKLTRVFLVVILANVGSTLGTILGGVGIFNIFKNLFIG